MIAAGALRFGSDPCHRRKAWVHRDKVLHATNAVTLAPPQERCHHPNG